MMTGFSFLSEAITENGIVSGSTNRCLCGCANIECGSVVVWNARLLLVQRSVDAFSDHELSCIDTSMDCLNSLVQIADDLLSGGGRCRNNLVDFTICHLNDTVSESFETNIVRHHDHSDLLAHVKIDEDFHDDVSTARVQITRGFIEQQNLRFVSNRARNCHSLLFATGKHIWEMIHSLFEADVLKELTSPVSDFFS